MSHHAPRLPERARPSVRYSGTSDRAGDTVIPGAILRSANTGPMGQFVEPVDTRKQRLERRVFGLEREERADLLPVDDGLNYNRIPSFGRCIRSGYSASVPRPALLGWA